MPWAPLTAADLDDVRALATACRVADGGLQVADDPAFLRSRWTGVAVAGRTLRDPDGRLMAAGAWRPPGTFTGMVHPEARGRGLGGALLDWGLDRPGPLTVETEGLTPAAEKLFAAHGLRPVFAERVMSMGLDAPVSAPAWPAGTERLSWNDGTLPRFHAVYVQAFRERPGFPGWSAAEFAAFVADDDEFRPEWSVLAVVPGVGDAGFVTAGAGWITQGTGPTTQGTGPTTHGAGWIAQVGVVPPARGRGLGAALVRQTLGSMRTAGMTEAWLDVNVDNPAQRLYRRLGFEDRGVRARYQR